MGYHRAGFVVTGVDIKAQRHYPFEFRQGDALSYPLRGFDAIHASPPCQAWTAYNRRPGYVGAVDELVAFMRERLRECGVPTVIENVEGAGLRRPLMLCGSMFGLDVQRHRYFEVSVPLPSPPPCRHSIWTPRFHPATNRSNLRKTVEVGAGRIPMKVQQAAMGIDWMSRRELSQAVPPAYTNWIGDQVLAEAA